jgi:hypothetical protein
MFGVFVLKVKNFSPKNDPKKLLKLSDEEFVGVMRTTPRMVYFLHHKSTSDQLTDIEKIEFTKTYWDDNYSVPLKKVRGAENCYQDENSTFFIKVLTKEEEWFKKFFN